MPKFCVQTYARIYLGGFEVEANSYHSRSLRPNATSEEKCVEGKDEEGAWITGQYIEVEDAEPYLRRGSTFATVSQVSGGVDGRMLRLGANRRRSAKSLINLAYFLANDLLL